MSKELRIDFQGVAAFVPNRDFSTQPTRIDVVLRDLEEPRFIIDTKGTQCLVGSHHAWLEFSPQDRVKGSPGSKGPREQEGIIEIKKEGGQALGVLLLRRQHVSIQLDGQDLPVKAVAINDSVLAHLAVYHGQLKTAYQPKVTGTDEVAAAFPLTGGALSVLEKTDRCYQVPLHDGTVAATEVATTLRWTIPFEKDVVLRFAQNPTSPILRFRPTADALQLSIRNRELDELFKPKVPSIGGQDDPEYLVYGDSIVGGKPQVLISITNRPGGHKACGTGGIQACTGGSAFCP